MLARSAVLCCILVALVAAPAHGATFTVTSNNDVNDGTCGAHCSLREAIIAANTDVTAGTLDEIMFSGTMVITPATALPTATDDVVINGTDSAGCVWSPRSVGLDGNGAAFDGLTLGAGSSGSRVCRIGIRGFEDGIRIQDSSSSRVDGCRIGTNAAGEAADPNSQNGISLMDAPYAIIGGGGGGATLNIISGNGADGIDAAGASFGTAVQGNYVGLDKDGTTAIPNAGGVHIHSTALGSVVGSNDPAGRNIISGHATGTGVTAGAGEVVGNYIGTDVTGLLAVPNQVGVQAEGTTIVGRTAEAERNVISSNEIGVRAPAAAKVEGNWIGPAADGTALGGSQGVVLNGAGADVLDNVIAVDSYGVDVDNGADAIVQDNLIGLLPDGVTASAPTGDVGVRVTEGGEDVDVLGNTIARQSGNGIETSGDEVTIRGNVVGLDVNGAAAPNGGGIDVNGSTTIVGGPADADLNIVSSNTGTGVDLGPGPTLEGNWIGVGTDGTTPRGNGGVGVLVGETSTARVADNVVAHSGDDGIRVDSKAIGGELVGNRVFANGTGAGELGIDLAVSGVSPNDPGDTDQRLQNFPVLTSAHTEGGVTTVAGTIDTTPGRSIRVELFSGAACHPSGFGEAEQVLGTTTVTAGAGPTAFSTPVTTTAAGRVITATATDLTTKETSELSACRTVTAPAGPVVDPGQETATDTTTTTTTGTPTTAQPTPSPVAVVPIAPPAPKFPAKIRVLRNGVDDGVLDMLVEITARAVTPGAVLSIDYESSGKRTKFTVPITGTQIKVRRKLPSTQPKDTGITTVTYAGNAAVSPDSARLRAADGKSLLVRKVTSIANGRLAVEGTVVSTARGVVRVRLGYNKPDGSTAFLSWNAPIKGGTWKLAQALPAEAAGGGQLSIEFTGYEARGLRGEQTAKEVLP